jgi:hypothetical protein
MSKGKKEKDLEWEKRTLCSDGNCTGVIGADGRCKECGKPYEGDLPETGVSEARDSDEAEEHGAVAESVTENSEAPFPDTSEDLDLEWENRRLCSDGNCIGVIGADGRCKECGKPSED